MGPRGSPRVKLIALLFLALLTSCAVMNQQLKNPEVTVTDFNVTDVSVEEVAVNLHLNVKNPNPVALKANRINYALSFSGNNVTEGVFDQGINVPASGENTLMIPLKFKYSSLGNLLSSLLKNTYTKDYELTGSADFGFFSIPFKKTGQVEFNK